MKAIEIKNFRVHFNVGRPHVKQILKLIVSSNTDPAEKIADVIKTEANRRLKYLELTMIAKFPDLMLQKIGTEHAFLDLRASLAIVTLHEKDLCMLELFYTCFAPKTCLWYCPTEASFSRLFSSLYVETLLLRCLSQYHPLSRTSCFSTEWRG